MKAVSRNTGAALFSVLVAGRLTAAFSWMGIAGDVGMIAVAGMLFLAFCKGLTLFASALRKPALFSGTVCGFFFALGERMWQGGFPDNG